MAAIRDSKFYAWMAFILVIVILVFTFELRAVWWAFFDIFFLFIGAFSHLVAVVVKKVNPVVSRKLDMAAFVCLILAIIAFIAEYIAFQALIP